MSRVFLKKLTSLCLIVMVLTASGLCSCLDSHATEQAPGSATAAYCADDADHCPSCPAGDHSSADHDAASCFCSCHLPLLTQDIVIRHNPVVSTLVSVETFSALPEVWLDLFIPPQNLA
jgi:hypothetical protein